MSIYSLLRKIHSFYINNNSHRQFHKIAFCNIYKKVIGEELPESEFMKIKKKSPKIDKLNHDSIDCTLQILRKFNITAIEACKNPHIFCMNPITMDNYGEILKECGFINISPMYIIRYHTLVKSRTISQLKEGGLIASRTSLEDRLIQQLNEWPGVSYSRMDFDESKVSILKVRLHILGKYLEAKLNITPEEFDKYCRNYLPIKHKPLADIQEVLSLVQNKLNLDVSTIRRNGFLIATDPVKVKLTLEKVKTLAGLDIRDVAKIEPGIMNNNHESLIRIRSLLEEYRISEEAQRRCLKVYCLCPETVKTRLEELEATKEYHLLSSNPRVLSLVLHKKKMIARLNKIQAANKNCFSLNHLVSSRKVFANYITSFGQKIYGKDLAVIIQTRLDLIGDGNKNQNPEYNDSLEHIRKTLKRHKFWRHVALNVVDDNITYLKRNFSNDVIYKNVHLLLYPPVEVELYVSSLQYLRSNSTVRHQVGTNCNVIDHSRITDEQILSLALYEIEKQYQFSGDGIWNMTDSQRIESQVAS